MESELEMAIHENVVLGLEEQPQDLPPGVERRGAHRSPGEQRSSRSLAREQGSLRIRLSDNELRAAQLIQERFQLRSTVAALGFCLRTMAQMVEQGQLSEENLATQLPQHSGPSRRRGEQQSATQAPAVRPDPLARPVKQQPKALEEDQPLNPATEEGPSIADPPSEDSLQREEV